MTSGYHPLRLCVLSLFFLFLTSPVANGQPVIAHFDVAAAANNPDFLSDAASYENLTVSDLVRGPGIVSDPFWNAVPRLFAANKWTTASTRDQNDYFEFSVTPEPGFEVTYGQLSYGLFMEYDPDWVGPTEWDICYSTDGFATWTCEPRSIMLPGSPRVPSLYQESFTTDLSAIGTTDQPVTFRFYAYNRTGSEDDSLAGFGNAEDGSATAPGTVWRGTGADVTLTGSVTAEPLPVELVRFEALPEGHDVILFWATASERNNAGFEIQHARHSDWHALGFVEGAGNVASGEEYAFRATGLGTGVHTFRLRQVDLDGTYQYSSEVEIDVELADTHQLSAVYPNPFNPQAQFSMSVQRAQIVHISVYDLLGRVVATLHDGHLDSGRNHTFQINANSWTSGAYLIRVSGEGFSETRRVVLMK